MKAYLLGAAALFVAAPAAAQDWRPLAFMDEGGENYRIVYLDLAGVKTTPNNGREMRIAHYFGAPQTFSSGERYDWIEVTYALDCGAQTMHSINSVSMLPAGPVLTSTSVGKDIPFASNLAFLRAANAACDPAQAKLLQTTASLPREAPPRFAAATALAASGKSSDWVRTGMGGAAGQRITLFLDRSSIAAGAGSLRYATMLTVSERPGASPYSMTRLEIDCAAGTRRQLLSEFPRDPGDDGRMLIFPGDAAAPMTPNSIWATLRAPVCSNDYAGAKVYAMLPAAIRPTAFD